MATLFFRIFAPVKVIVKILFVVMLAAVPTFASAQAYVKLNALYAPVGVLNPSVEFAVSKHSSVAFDGTLS